MSAAALEGTSHRESSSPRGRHLEHEVQGRGAHSRRMTRVALPDLVWLPSDQKSVAVAHKFPGCPCERSREDPIEDWNHTGSPASPPPQVSTGILRAVECPKSAWFRSTVCLRVSLLRVPSSASRVTTSLGKPCTMTRFFSCAIPDSLLRSPLRLRVASPASRWQGSTR